MLIAEIKPSYSYFRDSYYQLQQCVFNSILTIQNDNKPIKLLFSSAGLKCMMSYGGANFGLNGSKDTFWLLLANLVIYYKTNKAE